ncbi:tripartite tricarboxylate transporter substrate binding protein BugD [Allofranklinella schreckenbergeri]|uniref:Tripartite tricarboxylate transporter substrate binding protein BugD n=1 Tax=Allofranklinella schreckenbergeri TaxID=1076744 RepID=A0A3M6QWI0_9BURK|nr:tripartite tricarboxylate transporter substrate-binding protein [Allofranklinella schreckenbergeri]RMW98477.1 tripartite tricarboxylate transporter substrate binding protein BugD [Allofranklinella schreckenbergeri]RMX07343.1 tripartite tricarboxylate transporter substrate binding protein BugD [Allofranklinella schreckenbergeri]RRD39812.1 tripartite tricarboxylate transporter substrate binding protein BugD [Comamonadaceae bacterium OH3737_COT-264]
MARLTALAAAAVAAVALAQPALAQSYPGSKPITIIVPFSAGGPTDKVARDFSEALRKHLGNASIVVDNAAGAGSTIGIAKAARATPDGHTLLLTHIGMSTIPTLYRKLSFNVLEDFEYLGIINDVPMTVIARPSMEASNFTGLLDWMKSTKNGVNLGNAGLGSASHLCGLMFQKAINMQLVTIPYGGTAPAIADLVGGQIDVLCDQTTNTTPQIAGKKVKAYAVTTPQRLSGELYKELPTLQEAGFKDFNVTIWHGLYAPKGTPKEVLDTINAALKKALQEPEFIQRQQGLGAVVANDERVEPAKHKAFVQSEIQKWGEVIKAAGQFAD